MVAGGGSQIAGEFGESVFVDVTHIQAAGFKPERRFYKRAANRAGPANHQQRFAVNGLRQGIVMRPQILSKQAFDPMSDVAGDEFFDGNEHDGGVVIG